MSQPDSWVVVVTERVKIGKRAEDWHTFERVAFGHTIPLRQRAANQLAKGFASFDKKFRSARVIKRKTAVSAGLLG